MVQSLGVAYHLKGRWLKMEGRCYINFGCLYQIADILSCIDGRFVNHCYARNIKSGKLLHYY